MFQAKNIHWSIGNNPILQGINLSISSGQVVGLVGPNGCGKTSFLNVINGFHTPSLGSLFFDDKDITHMTVEEKAREGIGRMFQSFGICSSLSVYENIALAYVQKIGWKQKVLPLSYLPQVMKDEIDDLLHTIHLYEKRNDLAGNLSGGQMRLLEIARLLLSKPKLYLLDEPVAGVSGKFKELISILLKKMVDVHTMVLIVEHDMAFLGQVVDTMYVLQAGKNFAEGTYEDIKNNTAVRELYFG